MKCYFCETTDGLRPYGPNGSMLCFPCLKASPEREANAKNEFLKQLRAAGNFVFIGTKEGPYPLKHAPAHIREILQEQTE